MRTIQLGATGLQVPVIALGCMRIGGMEMGIRICVFYIFLLSVKYERRIYERKRKTASTKKLSRGADIEKEAERYESVG